MSNGQATSLEKRLFVLGIIYPPLVMFFFRNKRDHDIQVAAGLIFGSFLHGVIAFLVVIIAWVISHLLPAHAESAQGVMAVFGGEVALAIILGVVGFITYSTLEDQQAL